MLAIHLIAIGERMPDWVREGVADYQKRIRGRVAFDVIEVPAIKRGKNADIARIIAEEDQRLLAAIPKGCVVIALDRVGKPLSTLEVVKQMESWLQSGDQVALLVGGPEGLSEDLLKRADGRWSLSSMTFAHPVVRVMLTEQIYRCYSILEGLPYHR